MDRAISVILRTSENRGDHAADVSQSHTLKENETVADLMGRIISNGLPFDFIELRYTWPPFEEIRWCRQCHRNTPHVKQDEQVRCLQCDAAHKPRDF
jgi:hypothetical protein